MIKYLGSKRQLIPQILQAVAQSNPGAKHVVDLFSGTSRVGHALKKRVIVCLPMITTNMLTG